MAAADNPFARLPRVPDFEVESTAVADGRPLLTPRTSGAFGIPGGQDISPDLTWSGVPEGARSFAVTVLRSSKPPARMKMRFGA
jgi:phosphatidylethanolamine-binding protein (PEBP) family uncharacterized protein